MKLPRLYKQILSLWASLNKAGHELCRALLAFTFFIASLAYSALASASGAGTLGDPYTALSDAYRTSTSGRYYFDLGSGVFEADVDNSEGGGWVLILQYVHDGGTNPAVSILGAGTDMPITSAAALGTDESADTTRWGHAGNTAMSQFTGDIELRWYGETSNHSRILNFRSTLGDDYVRTGLGGFGGVDSDFTALTAHTANLPATATNAYTDQGDYALTNFPYWNGGAEHWGVKGAGIGQDPTTGDRWEVDDFPGDASNDTIHRVWVRQASPLVVINTNDAGEGSLRQAILVANDRTDLDTVNFDITGAGPHIINPTSTLPFLSDAGITIDGTTQDSAFCGQLTTGTPHDLRIQIDGAGAGAAGVEGLVVNVDGVTIRGLSITGYSGHAITPIPGADNFVLECSYIGVEPDGITNDPNVTADSDNSVVRVSAVSNAIIRNNLISGNDDDTADRGVAYQGTTGGVIEGNIIGLNETGTASLGNGGGGIVVEAGSTSVTIGGTTGITRNIIGGNNGSGIALAGGSSATIIGNYLGVALDGIIDLGNGSDGVNVNGASTVAIIGNGTVAGRNIISGNGDDGVSTIGGANSTLLGNYIGLASDGMTAVSNTQNGVNVEAVSSSLNLGDGSTGGRNLISSNGSSGVFVNFAANAIILGNYIGVASDGFTERGNTFDGINLNSSATADIGDGTSGGRNVISGNGDDGIAVLNDSSATILRNYIGVTSDGVVAQGNGDVGVLVQSDSIVSVTENIIANNSSRGVFTGGDNTKVAILTNSIYGHTNLGIDNFASGSIVTPNDTGDGDVGPNELLNFPVLNSIMVDGSSTVTYNFTLDVPASANGYRVEFFKNSSSHSTGNGEGEVYLGFVDVAGPVTNDTGTFTASEAVSLGNIISATATRKTASSYDITSEFAANYTASAETPLVVTTMSDSGPGSLRAAITHANATPADDNITFDIPGSGPHDIQISSLLPPLADDGITIDGSTQPGASCGSSVDANGVLTDRNLQIMITAGVANQDTLRIDADNVTIKGLALGNIASGGHDGIDFNVSSGTVLCTHIGVAADGMTPLPIDGHGIETSTSGTATSVQIGDGTYAGRNVIANTNGAEVECSKNATLCDIRGNYIGVLADGFTPGTVTSNNTLWLGGNDAVVGGPTAPERNIIGISTRRGIGLSSGATGVTIQGNYIGVAADGVTMLDAGLSGTIDGIDDSDSSQTITNLTIRNNVIGGFPNYGIDLEDSTLSTTTIEGNNIGVGANGLADIGYGLSAIALGGTTNTALTIGGTGVGEGNTIGFMTSHGIRLTGTNGASILGNYIGVGGDGVTNTPNEGDGIQISNASNITIGNGTSGGRNIVSGNGDTTENGIRIRAGSSAISVLGNYIGLAADGLTAVPNALHGIDVDDIATNDITIGGTGAGDGNVVSSNGGRGLALSSGNDISVLGNFIGVAADGVTARGNTQSGVSLNNAITNVLIGDGTSAGANIIAHNGSDGIEVINSSQGAIAGNNIYANTGLGIDLTDDAVTANDSGDGDSGDNDLLNFPVLNQVTADGTTSVAYDFTLDVPAAANGYRVEFFKNSSADASGHGEGEIYLGFVDIAGPVTNETGSFTASEAVAVSDIISATATRKTASSFDITSEFAANTTAITAASPLIVTSTADTDTIGTLRFAINHANANTGDDAITFNIAGAGPHTITLVSALPQIMDDGISIDGTSQTGTVCGDLWSGVGHDLRVRIDGPTGFDGLDIRSDDVTIKAVSVTGFNIGLYAESSDNTVVQCNYFGLAPDGSAAGATNSTSARAMTMRSTTNPTLGGPSGADGNVIGASTGHGVVFVAGATGLSVQNNFIGTDPSGTAARANALDGLLLWTGTLTVSEISNNIISGNARDGIITFAGASISGTSGDILIQGNYIGVDRTGNTALPNGQHGWNGYDGTFANGMTIGGTGAGEGNVIAANGGHGFASVTDYDNVTFLGNSIGVGLDGSTELGNGESGIIMLAGNTLSVGNGTAAGRNIIAGNASTGLRLGAMTGADISGNHIGVGAGGTTNLGNGGHGIAILETSSSIIIGGTSSLDRNIISGNSLDGIFLQDTSSVDILGNYIGVAADGNTAFANLGQGLDFKSVSDINVGDGSTAGRNIISGNGNGGTFDHGVFLKSTTNLTIAGNYIGVTSGGNTARGNSGNAIIFQSLTGDSGHTNAIVSDNVLSGNSGGGTDLSSFNSSTLGATSTISFTGNKVGVGADGITSIPNGSYGIKNTNVPGQITIGGPNPGEGNIIANNPQEGIFSDSLSGLTMAILGNSIYSNGGVGIDNIRDGVTANDSGDGDTGPNDLLNFPVLNQVTADGTTSVGYDFTLDVPAAANGYRVEFFKNSSADASGHGEGEIYLGFVDVAGPVTNETGSFTASESVAVSDIISATATRKTASSFDITSEFAANTTAITPASPLIVTSTADTDTIGTLRFAINHANANTGDDNITFNISGTASLVHTITLASALPSITDAGISIDGSSQGDAMCGDLWDGTPHTIRVRLDGDGGAFDILTTDAADTVIKGLSITDSTNGIVFGSTSTNGIVQCSYLGLTPDGTEAGHADRGVQVYGAGTLIGGLTVGEGNVISGNTGGGIVSEDGASAMMVRGNFIGTDPSGLAARPNADLPVNHGTGAATWSDITKNLISGNNSAFGDIGGIRLHVDDTITGSSGDVLIRGNYIGVDRTGNTALGNGGDSIFINAPSSGFTIGGTSAVDRNILAWGEVDLRASNMSVLGNYIGVGADGVTRINPGGQNLHLRSSSNVTVGDGTVQGRNIIAGGGNGVRLVSMSNSIIQGNYIGIGADGTTDIAGSDSGFNISGSNTNIKITNNIIANFGNDGISISGSGDMVSILENNIYGNDGLGIDISADGVTANDSGDADTGPNDLLNFPVLNFVSGNGTTSVGYDFDLDVPSNISGYRVEFFANSSADPSGHGEGETYLGFVDTGNHTGGVINYNGTLTALQSVSDGAIVSATATRKTGGASFDVTSEFSLNAIADSPNDFSDAPLTATSFGSASHMIVNGSRMGATIDGEPSAFDSADASADLDDGVTLPSFTQGAVSNISIAVSQTGGTHYLQAWADWNDDKDWNDLDEQIAVNIQDGGAGDTDGTANGVIVLATTTPGFAVTGSIFMRFRWSSTNNLSTTASASDGEVEDYQATIGGGAMLAGARAVEVYDPSSLGLYNTPGNDVIVSVTVTNEGEGTADVDSIEIIDEVSDELRFFSGTTIEFGGQVVGFEDSSSGLSFNPANDVKYSNAGSRPATFADCTYTVGAGYDPDVTYVCIRPTGAMAANDPDPSFTVKYRAKIE